MTLGSNTNIWFGKRLRAPRVTASKRPSTFIGAINRPAAHTIEGHHSILAPRGVAEHPINIDEGRKMASVKATRTTTDWKDLVYSDEQNRPCIDLMANPVRRQVLVQELVCMLYHGPCPFPDSIAHVIDPSKQCTPDNVGWLSRKPHAWASIAPELIRTETSKTKEIERPLKRADISVEWDKLFLVDEVGDLYPSDWNEKETFPEGSLLEHRWGPWPGQEGYDFIIDLSKPQEAGNLGWMIQDPDYRTVKYG
jgi:hypothetical protein